MGSFHCVFAFLARVSTLNGFAGAGTERFDGRVNVTIGATFQFNTLIGSRVIVVIALTIFAVFFFFYSPSDYYFCERAALLLALR